MSAEESWVRTTISGFTVEDFKNIDRTRLIAARNEPEVAMLLRWIVDFDLFVSRNRKRSAHVARCLVSAGLELYFCLAFVEPKS